MSAEALADIAIAAVKTLLREREQARECARANLRDFNRANSALGVLHRGLTAIRDDVSKLTDQTKVGPLTHMTLTLVAKECERLLIQAQEAGRIVEPLPAPPAGLDSSSGHEALA